MERVSAASASRRGQLSARQIGYLRYALSHTDAEFSESDDALGLIELEDLVQRGLMDEQRIGTHLLFRPASGLQQKLTGLL